MDYSTWTYNWNQKNLNEILNRSMDTRFKRLTLRLDSQPFRLGGSTASRSKPSAASATLKR